MRKPKNAYIAGGMFMFEEFEPAPAPVEPATVPLFTVDTITASAPDYGVAVAPVREAVTGSLFAVELVVGEDGALDLGIAD